MRKNIGKNISKHLSGKYNQKPFVHAQHRSTQNCFRKGNL